MVAIVSGDSLGLSLTSLVTLGQAGGLGSAAPGRSGEQTYLNIATGNLVLQRRDGYLASQGQDLDVLRTYNSQGRLAGDEDCWGIGVARQRLLLTGPLNTTGSTVKRTARDGAEASYTWDPAAGLYRCTEGAGAHDSIAWDITTNQWTWIDGDTGVVERHDDAGRLVSSTDATGNTLTFSYDIDGRLTQTLSASGESVNYDYSDGHLTQVRSALAGDAMVTQVHYSYDASNRLTQVVVDLSPADNAVTDGHVYRTNYTYDGASSRIASVTQSDGTSLAFSYQQVGADYKVISVADALGQTTCYAYDEINRRTTVVDPMGFSSMYDYDAAGQLVRCASTVDGGLQTREFAYNSRGDVISVTDGLGQATMMEYDMAGNLVLQRDAAGNTVTRTYTAQNQLASETVYLTPDPDGAGTAAPGEPQTTRYIYDSARPRLLRFVLSPQGRLTEHRYDGYGQRTASLSYAGAACTLTTLTDATLAAWAANQGSDGVSRTDMAYDFRGQLQTVTAWGGIDANGQGVVGTTHYVYDATGQLLQTLDATGGVASYTYDGLGRLRTSTDALGNVAITSYDDAHNSTTLTLSSGLATTSSYDRAGRLTSTLVSGSGQQVSQYYYDADNRLVMTQDPTGVRAWMLYDEAGRKVADVDGNGSLTEYVYNKNNRVTQTIRYARPADLSQLINSTGQPIKPALALVRPAASGDDQKQWAAYDSAGRLVKTVDAQGAVSETFYDGASRVVAVRHYANTVITARLSNAPSAASIAPVADALQDRVSRNFHDADGLLRATLDGEGYLVELSHDSAGRQIQRIAYATATQASLRAAGTLAQLLPAASADDIATRALYNARGLVVGELDGEGYLTEHVYDADGNRTQSVRYAAKVSGTVTDASTVADLRPAGSPADQVSRWVYDEGNRVIQDTNAEGTVTQRSYDSAGNMVKSVVAAGTSDMRTLVSRYDVQGRLVGELSGEGGALLTGNQTQSQVDSIWAQYGITHAYDASGRRISTTDQDGHKTLFFHDADGRLTYTVNALGEVTESQYNALGQHVAEIRYGTRISPLAFDGGLTGNALRNALDAIRSSALDSKTTHTYNTSGTLASSTDALGIATTYAYNAFGEQTTNTVQLNTDGASAQTVSQTVTRDRRGLQVGSVSDAGGLNAVTSAVYDAFGRVTRTVDANGNARDQAYDRLGRVVTATDPLNATRSTGYDAFDRVLTQTDALGQTTRYSYDSAARSVSVTTPENITVTTIHTRLGQTHSVTDGRGNTTTYAYDANGNLETTSTALTTSTSDYDRAGLLSRTTDANGNQVTLTYDGANRLLARTVDPGGLNLVTRYGYDAKGQQISVTDANGVVTELAYDLRGQLIRQAVDPTGLNLVTRYSYDGRGKALSVTEPGGTVTQYSYDKLGRRTGERVDPAGLNLTRSYGYGANGNLTSATDANGHTTQYVYDADDRLSATINALGEVVKYSYDAGGNLVRRIECATPVAAGAALASVAASAADRITAYAYDAAGRQTLVVDSLGGVTQSVYDSNGNLTRHTAYARAVAAPAATGALDPAVVLGQLQPDSANDRTQRVVYDAANRAVFAVDSTGAVVQTQYDAAGNATRSIAYANGINADGLAANASVATVHAALTADAANDRITRRAFDAGNRLVYAVDALGYVKKTSYDALGRVTGTTEYATQFAGLQEGNADIAAAVGSSESGMDRTTRVTYDAAGHVLSSTGGLGQQESYSYDGLGNKTRYVNKKGDVWTYEYDAAGRLRQETSPPADLVAVRQDADGNLEVDAANTTTAPIITRLSYDALGNLVERTEAVGRPEERTTLYEYDALGRQIRTVFTQVGVYDSATDDLVNNGAAGTATRADSLHTLVTLTQYDTLGNAVASRDLAGNYSYKSYDRLGRVAWDIDALGQATGYERNAFGEVIRLTRHAQPAVALNNLSARSVGTLTIAAGQPPVLTDTSPAGDLPGIPGANFQPPLLRWTTAPAAVSTTVRYKPPGSSVWSDALISHQNGTDSLLIPADLPAGAYDIEIEQRDAASMGEQRVSAAIIRDAAQDRTLVTTYDRAGRVTQVVEPRVYAYDATTRQAYADAAKTTRNTYNAFGEVVRVDELSNPVTQSWTSTVSYYDQRGQLSATVDALGYATVQTYDAAGNVVLRTEYANALAGWNPAAANLAQLPGAPAASDDNRTTLTRYDRANRKTSETRVNVLVSDDGVASARRNLTTTYGYDAVDNLTRTTDALGNSTYSYYDRLGRVVAVAEPARQDIVTGVTLTPLTEFKRDAYGNVLLKTQRGLGAATATDTGYTSADAITDRLDYAAYDRQGRQTQTTDALRASRHTSYNEHGVVAKTWQGVTDGEGDEEGANTRTLYQAYRYDALGRLTHTLDPAPDALGQRSAALVDTSVQYNAFGEITRRASSALPGAAEYFDYDRAGRIWRTNSGDGVDRVMLYDVQGHATAEIRSAGTLDLRQLAGPAAAGALSGDVRRSETARDALGRVVVQRLPQHIETQGGVSVVHMTAGFANQLSAQVTQATSGAAWSGTNQVDLSWTSLASLGSGDVKVEFEYLTQVYDRPQGTYTLYGEVDTEGTLPAIHSDGVIRSVTHVYTGAEADAGGRLQWTDPLSGQHGGIEHMTHLAVYKKDRDGLWRKVIDQYPLGDVSNSVLVAAPQDPATSVVLEFRLSGGNGPWLTSGAVNFGDQLRFTVDALAEGSYDYQVKTTLVGGSAQITATGTISLASPPLAVITTALAHGSWGEGVLAWQKPADGVVQTLRFRPAGSTGIWSTLPIGAPDATHSGVNVFMLASANYEYELLYSNAGELHPFAHGTGQFNVTGAQGVPPIAGASFGVDDVGGARLQWPALAGTTAQLRYKLTSSSVWTDGNASILATTDPQTAVIGSGLAAGNYDVELTRKDASGTPIGLATAQLTIRPRIYPPVGMVETTPAYVPAYTLPAENLPRIDGAVFTAGASGSWMLTWPTPAAGTTAHLRYRVASGGAWMDASALIQTAGAQQGVSVGPGAMPPGSYDVEAYFTVEGAATAQATGRLTVSTDTAVPAQMADTTPVYKPAMAVAALNHPVIGVLFTANADGSWALAWPRPPAGTSATVRYRPAGGAGQPYIDASDRIASLDAQNQRITMAPGDLEAGNWDIELFYSSGGLRTAQAMGRLTVPTAVPQAPLLALNPSAYVPAHFSVSNTTAAGTPALSEAGALSWAGSFISQQISNLGANAQLMVQPEIRQSLDRWGNVVQVSDPRNVGWTTRYEYDANNQIVRQSQSDEQGRHDTAGTAITRLYYDALGRQLGVLDANGHLNRQQWDAGGQLVQEIHADGGTITNRYDIFGDKAQTAVQTSAASSVLTAYAYDKLSRLTTTTHAPVVVSQVVINGDDWSTSGASAVLTDRYTWDQAGRQTRQTNGANETTRYRYDLRGNITQTTGAGISVNGHGPVSQTAWDAQGRKIAEQDANGHTTTWTYNYFGRLTGHADLGGASHAYTYNNAGQLTRQTSTRGQDIAYEYSLEGYNTKTTDYALNTVTRIAYDQAGRHVRERTSQVHQRADASLYETVLQDNQLAYDHLGRLVWVTDARAFVGISYDKVGNRTQIHTRALEPATGDGQVHGQAGGDLDRYYAYDAMNRQIEAEGHHLTYDLAGNKTSDTWLGRKVLTEELPAQYITQYDANGEPYQVQTVAAQTRYTGVEGQNTTERYTYDALGRLSDIQRDGMLTDKRYYDAAGRLVQSGATPAGVPAQYLIALAGTNNQGQPLPGNGVETKLYVYDDQGRLQAQRTIDQQNDRLKYTLDYGNRSETADGVQKQVAGYDGAGNLLGYTLADHLQGVGSDYRTSYTRYEGYKETQTTVTGSAGTSGSSASEYDANGNLVKVRDTTQTANDRVFFNDVQGKVLQVTQGAHIQRQLIANGEVLGRFGEAVDDQVARGPNGEPSFTSVADFSFGFTATAGNTPNNAPRSHVVSAGDTLQSIAQRLYGDSRMWYRIADANAVTGNDNLRPGQVLAIPPADLTANAATTFNPYDPARIVGDTTPNLPAPPRKSGGGGLFGEVLSLVIAAIVTYLTAGAAAAYFHVVMTQVSAASIAIAAGAGAVGSLAGQIMGIATGAQDSISWKGVALAALSAGVTQGVAPGLITNQAKPASWGTAVVRAALSHAVTQGIAVATGLQDRFNWKGVVASAVGSGACQAVGDALGPALKRVQPALLGDVAARTLTGLAAGAATALARGGRISVQQMATDAFGNALGDSIVGMMAQPAESIYSLANGDGKQGMRWGGPVPAQDMDEQAWERLRMDLGLPSPAPDESWVLAANARAGYSLGRSPAPAAPSTSGLGAVEDAARSLRDDLVEAAARIRSGIGRWLPFGQGASAPNFYPGYDLGTQEGMGKFLDDTSWKRRIKEDLTPQELSTAKTILSAYYGIDGTEDKAFATWGKLSEVQISSRFDANVAKQIVWSRLNTKFDTRIDFAELTRFEGGQQLRGYVPMQNGAVLGRSGVTIATGFDIGQMNTSQIEGLELPRALQEKIVPYAFPKIRNEAVAYLGKNPLVVTRREASELDYAVKGLHLSAAIESWNQGKPTATPNFERLSGAQQTVIFSRTFHQGLNMPETSVARSFYKAGKEGRWKDAEAALRNYDVTAKWYKNRVAAEANLLKKERLSHGN